MKTLKRVAVLVVASVVLPLAVLVPAQSASAGPVTTLGCQTNHLMVTEPNTHGVYTHHLYYCSGTYTVNKWIIRVRTGPWGGYFYASGTTHYFCDAQTWSWSYHVYISTLYMAATRPSWC